MRAGSQTWTTILTRLRTKAVDAGYSGRIRPPPVVGPALPPRPGPVTGRTHAPEVPQAPHSRCPDVPTARILTPPALRTTNRHLRDPATMTPTHA